MGPIRQVMMVMTNTRLPVCDYEGSDYQTGFWEQGGRSYEDQVEAVALGRLLPPSGNLLLEVGAGAGRNTPRYRGFKRIVLLDYSRTQLKQAQNRLGNNQRYIYVLADAYRLPFVPGLFDAATLIRTLHHMVDAPKVLQQVRQVLRPGGIFIIEYANKQNLKAILRYLLRLQAWSPFSLSPVEFATLNFDFHPQAIRQWLTACDFVLERQLTVSHFRSGLLKRFIPLPWLIKMDSWAQLTGDRWQLSPSVFARCRAVGDSGTTPLGAFFRCPACSHIPLQQAAELVICSNCGRSWKIKDGIYDFRDDGD